MSALNKAEAIEILNGMSEEQKEEFRRLKSQGLSPSWALRKAQAATKQDEVRQEATDDVSMGDRMAAGATRLGAGLSGPFADVVPAIGGVMDAAGRKMQGKSVDLDASIRDQQEIQEIAKRISPSLGSVDLPVVGEVAFDPELIGNAMIPSKVAAKPGLALADAGTAAAKNAAKRTGAKIAKAAEKPVEKMAKLDDFIEEIPIGIKSVGTIGAAMLNPAILAAGVALKAGTSKAKKSVVGKAAKAAELADETILKGLGIAPTKRAISVVKKERELFDPLELVEQNRRRNHQSPLMEQAITEVDHTGKVSVETAEELFKQFLKQRDSFNPIGLD